MTDEHEAPQRPREPALEHAEALEDEREDEVSGGLH